MGYSLHLTSRLLALIAFLALAFAGMAYAQSALAQTYEADLSGEEEVPPVDADTTGFIEAEFDEELSSVDYDLDVFDGEAIVAAHFHCAPEGENGPVIAFLFGPESDGVDVDGGLASGTIVDDDLLEAGMDCPTPISDVESLETAMAEGDIYTNVHSEEFPDGVARGQMVEAVDSDDDDDDTATSTDDDDDDTATSTDDDDATNDDDTATSTDDDVSDDETATDTVSVALVKHICPDDIDSVEEFLDIGRIAERLEHCQVVTLPGDEQTEYAEGEDIGEFDFRVTDDDGEEQTIDDATFFEAAYCEDDFPVDFDGDDSIEEDVCIDLSHYVYEGVADGSVTVEEIESPENTSFGYGYLEFELPTEEDFAEDEDAGLEPFDESEVTFDTTDDDDGVIVVHVFNFRDADEDDDDVDEDENGTNEGDDATDDDQDSDNEALERRIQRLEERIDRLMERLERQFDRMEELIQQR
jgi:hypothetical protein